jgi:hypothetical protein
MFESLSVRSVAQWCKPRDAHSRLRVVRRNTPSSVCSPYDSCQPHKESHLEVFLLLWDEMDDWIAAARHLLRNLT